jgi:hypothetical protein
LFRNKQTSDPLMVNVLLARRINGLIGGLAVSPWTVGEIPQDWIDAVLNLENNSVLNQSWEKVEEKFAEFRRNHARK